jgi:hypothetical protein
MKATRSLNAFGNSSKLAFAIIVLLLLAIVPLSPRLEAQTFYGSISGTATDATGALVPDATVTVTNVGTNDAQTVHSDKEGKFSFVNLVPAVYKVDVAKAGFKRFVIDQLTVEVGGDSHVDARLQVGAATETVEVSTQVPLLQPDSSSLTSEISGDEVQQMPLNGRNVENLIALAPGVVPGGGTMGDTGLNQGTRTGQNGWNNYQIGGAIQGQSAQYIDGVPNNILGGNDIALIPTQDAIQEFSVISSDAPADFGRFAGGVVNMTTKSGSNAFHGSAYEYLRNADFNANDFFSNQIDSARPKDNQNQYGVVFGGPIKRDKVFFLFTWEGFAGLFGDLVPTNVPTTAASRATWGGSDMQDGIFANAIHDPLGNCTISTTVNPGFWTITNLYAPGSNCGDPLNNIIRTFYRSPNLNPNTATSNWELTTPLLNHQNQYNGRIDYTLSDKQRIFGRYTYWNLHDTGHSEWLEKGLNGTSWPTNDGANGNFTQQFVLGDTYAFNPTTVLDVRANYVRSTDPNLADSTSVNEAQFGSYYATLAPQMSFHTIPSFNASGGLHNLYNMGNYPHTSTTWWNVYGIDASLVKIMGPHSLKIGTELRLMDQSSFGGASGGSYSYSTGFTGDEWASFLMGYSTASSFATSGEVAAYTYYQAYYATDTWQATRNLTLNLGLRYELPGGISERNNKSTVLLPNAVDPATNGAGITGTEALVNSSLYPHRSTVIPKFNLFAPRVGIAYRIGANTVIQGGYGISYLPNDITGGITTPVNGFTTSISNNGSLPVPLQSNLATIAAAGLTQPFGRTNPNFMNLYGCSSLSCGGYLKQSISGPDPYQSFPYVQQWNVALNHEFKGNWMAGVAYSGLKGTNLPGAGHQLDQLPDQYDSMGTALTATATSCAAAPGLVGSPNTFTVGQCLRPFPYYNGFSDTAEWYAWEHYRSLQARAEKRFGAHGVVSANFTTSKNMANTDTQNASVEPKATVQGGNGNGFLQDYNNPAGDYSLISFDVTNRLIIDYVLNLPFGKGQKYGNNFSGIANALASGWALNGITNVQSGFPVFLSTTTSNKLQTTFGAGTTRPNVVPGCNKKLVGSGLTRVNAGGWFNVTCFSYAGDYAFGNEPRVDPDLRADGIKNFDLAFKKATPIHESANLEFRTEFFNIFNRVQFAPPGNVAPVSATSPNVIAGAAANGNFGQVAYQVNHPRQIQFSLRLNF